MVGLRREAARRLHGQRAGVTCGITHQGRDSTGRKGRESAVGRKNLICNDARAAHAPSLHVQCFELVYLLFVFLCFGEEALVKIPGPRHKHASHGDNTITPSPSAPTHIPLLL